LGCRVHGVTFSLPVFLSRAWSCGQRGLRSGPSRSVQRLATGSNGDNPSQRAVQSAPSAFARIVIEPSHSKSMLILRAVASPNYSSWSWPALRWGFRPPGWWWSLDAEPPWSRRDGGVTCGGGSKKSIGVRSHGDYARTWNSRLLRGQDAWSRWVKVLAGAGWVRATTAHAGC
jgi:hypothetical protein